MNHTNDYIRVGVKFYKIIHKTDRYGVKALCMPWRQAHEFSWLLISDHECSRIFMST